MIEYKLHQFLGQLSLSAAAAGLVKVFIHSKIYIVPLQGNYSEALPTPVWTKR